MYTRAVEYNGVTLKRQCDEIFTLSLDKKLLLGPLSTGKKGLANCLILEDICEKFILGVVFDYANMMLRRRCLCGHYVGKLLFLALLWTLMFIIIFYNFFSSFDHYSPVILASRSRIFEPLERPRSRMIPTTMQCK